MQVENQTDLKRLCEVSRTIYEVSVPHLYRSIVFKVDASAVDDLDVVPLLRTRSWPMNSLRSAKQLHIRTRNLPGYCPYHPYHRDLYMDDRDVWDSETFEAEILHLFKQLKNESLEEFRYHRPVSEESQI